MLLFSYDYLFFLFAAFALYNLINIKFRYIVLFVASVVFISSISIKVALFSILFTTLNYFLGIFLERARKYPGLKTKIFWSGIILNVGFLAFFKYINFIFENINSFAKTVSLNVELPYLNLIILIGVSYYTFQSLGYLIRINRGGEDAIQNYAKFATFLLFFPKFLSGPVERSQHFFPQIDNLKKFDQQGVTDGLRLFLWGAFKKIVIANTLYEPVSQIYNDVHGYSGIPLIAVFFIQLIYIYCDFSGYTDMALGSAKIFGIDLIDNFKRPFLARTISEFWKRWHISLSSWCNDFIFNPFIVKYRRLGNTAAVLGIFLTFFIIGIWHGANWTFVILGLLQGIAIVYEFYTKKFRLKIASRFPRSIVFGVSRLIVITYMSLSMVFFFSHSLADAWYFITHLFSGFEFVFHGFELVSNKPKFLIALGLFLLMFIAEMYSESIKDIPTLFFNQPQWVRWGGYYLIIILLYIYNSDVEAFVYMEF